MRSKPALVKIASKRTAIVERPATRTRKASKPSTDWERLRNMTDEEALANARSDPDNPPYDDRKPGNPPMRRGSIAKRIRWKLRMSQSQFAEDFNIPLGTLRDWEQHRRDPDQSAQAYLAVILHEPDAVRRALAEWARTGVMGAIETTES